jgi:uncharacterized protein
MMPIRPKDRLTSLDLVRGVTLLGILPANLPWFVGPPGEPHGLADRVAAAAVLLFIDFKMVTALAILFGAGLAMQEAAARQRHDLDFGAKYLWRQALLFLLGLSHGLLLWFGDILATYAMIGSAALVVVLLGSNWVRWVSIACLAWFYALVLALMLVVAVTKAEPPQPKQSDNTDGPPVSLLHGDGIPADRLKEYFTPANQIRIYRNGTFADMVENRAVFLLVSLPSLLIIMGWYLLGCFLIGMQLVWAGLFHGVARRWWAEFFLMLGLTIGVPCHLVAVFISLKWPGTAWPNLLNLVGGLPQSLMYIGLLVLWDDAGGWDWLRDRLRAVGRMALTNYLMQSVLLSLVFYNFGLGWYGRTGLALAMPLVPLIWALELWWSPIWLSWFASGPVEWAWRSLADWRVQPILART